MANVSCIWMVDLNWSAGRSIFIISKNNVYWGAILPVLYVPFIIIWLPERFGKEITFSVILAAVGGLVFLLGMWINGREYLKKKRKKELEKMELHDIE